MISTITFLGHQLIIYKLVQWSILLKELLVIWVIYGGEDSLEEAFALVFINGVLKSILFFFSRLTTMSCRT